MTATESELLSHFAYGLAPTVDSKMQMGISMASAMVHETSDGLMMPVRLY